MCFFGKDNLTEIIPLDNNSRIKDVTKIIRILIVDDNPIYKKILENYLTNIGYLVVCAGNGKEGLENTNFTDFDMIVCDTHMPIMDGIEFCETINKLEKNPKVLILYSDYEIVTYNNNLNLDFYVNRRFTPNEINTIIEDNIL